MTKDQALIPVEQKFVDFYGDEITAVLTEENEKRQIFVPVRPICDYLGLSWSGQRERINRDPVLSDAVRFVRVTRTNSQGGNPNVLALPLDYLNGWLFGVNANRVKEEIRDNLIRYQRECYRVLADAFLPPDLVVQPVDADDQALVQLHNMALVIAATTREMLEVRRMALDNQSRLDAAREYLQGINKRLRVVEQRTQTGPLTEEQAREIQHRVNLIAQKLSKHKPGEKHHMGVYEALRQETGATSYKSIPLKGYKAAVTFLDNWLAAIQQISDSD
jgi:hypothetical protein